jgi:hypothetical protein
MCRCVIPPWRSRTRCRERAGLGGETFVSFDKKAVELPSKRGESAFLLF